MKKIRWTKGKIFLAILAGAIFFPAVNLMLNRAHHETKVAFRWHTLSTAEEGFSAEESDETVFSTRMIKDLPVAAKRYLLHAIVPGTPLADRVQLKMSGALRQEDTQEWVPFEAEEILAGGRGLVWKAKLRTGEDAWLDGAEYYYRGKGQVTYFRYRFIPSVLESSFVVDRSMAGRVLVESIWLPPVFLPQRAARWENMDEHRAKVTLSIDDLSSTILMTVGADGRLREVVIPRYHQGEDRQFENAEWRPFGITVEEENVFGGYRIPSKIRAGWWHGSSRYTEVFRAEIKEAAFY
jgi:Family of unknown function (DUF6920)